MEESISRSAVETNRPIFMSAKGLLLKRCKSLPPILLLPEMGKVFLEMTGIFHRNLANFFLFINSCKLSRSVLYDL